MKIKHSDQYLLILEDPNLTHKMICIIFIAIGAIGSTAVIASGEGLHNGIVLYLLLTAGIIGFIKGGKPDRATFNKDTNQLYLTRYKGSFSKPVHTEYNFNEIQSTGMDRMISSSNNSSFALQKCYNLYVTLKNNKKIELCVYTNRKKFRTRALEKIQAFLELKRA